MKSKTPIFPITHNPFEVGLIKQPSKKLKSNMTRIYYIIMGLAILMLFTCSPAHSQTIKVNDYVTIDTTKKVTMDFLLMHGDSSYEFYWRDKMVGYYYQDSLVIKDTTGAILIFWETIKQLQKQSDKNMWVATYLEEMLRHCRHDGSKEFYRMQNKYLEYKKQK